MQEASQEPLGGTPEGAEEESCYLMTSTASPTPLTPCWMSGRCSTSRDRHGVRGAAVTGIDETGGEARVYVIDEPLVVKVQRPHRLRPRTSLEKEAFFLHQLSAHPDIVVPQVLGYGRHDTIEYLVMTRMPGVSALTVELTGAKQDGRVASAREDLATPPRDSPGAVR